MDYNLYIEDKKENEPLIDYLKTVEAVKEVKNKKGKKEPKEAAGIIPAEDPDMSPTAIAGIFSHIKCSTKAYRMKQWQRK